MEDVEGETKNIERERKELEGRGPEITLVLK
jgi:hypothetical protein